MSTTQKNLEVKCEKCDKKFFLHIAMNERPCPPPNHKIVEGYLYCPYCFFEKHVYFLSPKTLQIRYNLRLAVDLLVRKQSLQSRKLVFSARQAHQRAYDQDQIDYAFLIEEIYEHTASA